MRKFRLYAHQSGYRLIPRGASGAQGRGVRRLDSSVQVDFPAVLERAQRIALESRQGLDKKFEGVDNPRLLRGQARLLGRTEAGFQVQVGEQTLTASHVVLNVGTRTLVPPIEGLRDVKFLDAGNWLHRPDLPAHLAIIGGGYIGLEMAQFYRRMGSKVTVIQRGHQITDREDRTLPTRCSKFWKRRVSHFT